MPRSRSNKHNCFACMNSFACSNIKNRGGKFCRCNQEVFNAGNGIPLTTVYFCCSECYNRETSRSEFIDFADSVFI